MTQASISLVTLSLFVCSVHLYPSIQPSLSSHSLIGDSMTECLDSLQLTSLVLTALWLYCLLTKVTEHKAEMCLWHDCVFVLTMLQKPRHMRSVHCADHITHIQSLHYSHGKQPGVVLHSACTGFAHRFRPTTEIDLRGLNISSKLQITLSDRSLNVGEKYIQNPKVAQSVICSWEFYISNSW